MAVPQDAVRWLNASQGQGSCVDLANTGKAIRDSKNPDGPILKTRVGFAGLLDVVKSGKFDN